MILKLIRKLIPITVRQAVGLRVLAWAGRSWTLGRIVFYILLGKCPTGIWAVSKRDCAYRYNGRVIRAPRDGILAFMEVFHDSIYETHWKPKLGDVVIDAGAYVGMFSVKASYAVGPGGRVLAFEPASSNFEYLVANTKGLDNVLSYPQALGERWDVADLYISGASPCHTFLRKSGRHEKVLILPIDKLTERADFIKIDAEGSELAILKGAERILKAGCKVAAATYHSQEETAEVVEYLSGLGYRTIIDERGYVFAEKL